MLIKSLNWLYDCKESCAEAENDDGHQEFFRYKQAECGFGQLVKNSRYNTGYKYAAERAEDRCSDDDDELLVEAKSNALTFCEAYCSQLCVLP